MSACSRESRWKEALDLLDLMPFMHHSPNAYCYNTAASACARAGHWEKSLELLSSMRRHGIGPDAVAFNAAMAAALEADHPDQALQLLRGMAQKLGKGQFNSILFYRLHECDKLRLGVQPSVVSYGTAMLASNRLGHWEDALALLDELRSSGQCPDSGCLHAARFAAKQDTANMHELSRSLSLEISSASRPIRDPQPQERSAPKEPNIADISRLASCGQWQEALTLLESLEPDAECIKAANYSGHPRDNSTLKTKRCKGTQPTLGLQPQDWDLAFQMALYPASRFHFSLFVIDLKKEEQLQLAKECLSRWFGEDVPQTLQGRNQLEIELAELACFDKKEDVLFLQPDDQSATEMSDLNRTLQARLSTCMLAEKQRPTLQPHATIMKKSQVGRKLGQKLDANRVKSIMKTLRFPREAWSEYNKSLGKYAAREVQLLDMRKPKDGYFEAWQVFELVPELLAARVLGLDCEGVSLGRWGRLCLCQVATPGQAEIYWICIFA
eukprot:g2210.t1